MPSDSLPLEGIRVLSLAEQFPGPLCTQLLADLGAEVTLLERPGKGDPQRDVGPWLFRFAGRGKRSITLNLKDPDGLEAARKLVARSQVLLEGFRPGVMGRLGLGFEDVGKLNPSLVYCSISGYGQDGPYRDDSGHNINYEAVSGLLDPLLDSRVTDAFLGGPPWGDILSGLIATVGIIAAVRKAERDGSGSHLDIAITDSLVFALGPTLTRYFNGAEAWSVRESSYGIFECADGHVALGINHEDHLWEALCEHADLPQYSGMDHWERLRKRGEIRGALEDRLRLKSVNHWVKALSASGACSRINRLGDVVSDPQLHRRGLFVTGRDEHGREFRTVNSPFTRGSAASGVVPALGAATAEVLAELGVGPEVLERLLHDQDQTR